MGTCKSKPSVVDSTEYVKKNGASNGDAGASKLNTFRSKDSGKSLDISTHSVSNRGKRLDPMDVSTHSVGGRRNKDLLHSSSVLGLDRLIDDRREEGDLRNNIVHIEIPFGKPIEEVYDGVHDGKILGSGISGTVRLCSHKSTGVKYAVKCLDLDQIESDEGLQQLRDEIGIMCQLDHPNIIRLEEVYESYNEIYLVQELCTGGELFDRLDEQPDYHYSEAQCARLVKQMLSSVRYLHSKGIIHRDLKLENFLFSNRKPDSELKMIDFGLSKHFKFGDIHHEAVGTPYTVAPEVIRGSYDERCDMWAIGVITYLLLSGDPPFGGCGGPEPLTQVRANILRANYKFEPAEIWDHVSEEAKAFIGSLLVTDPKKRLSAREAQKNDWLEAGKDRRDNTLNPHVVKALVNFKEYSDMRKLLCEVLSFTLLPEQITDLRKEFEKLDTDGTGEISLSGLKQVLLHGAGSGSLGAFTESEIEDIFNAIRVRTSETTRIHWHEFLAAGISQCEIDARNLRLAFDRLDSDHKGFITFDDIMDLMGKDGLGKEETMRAMWGETMNACNANDARITYDEFLLLMKGQSTDEKRSHRRSSGVKKVGGVSPTASPKYATLHPQDPQELMDLTTTTAGQVDSVKDKSTEIAQESKLDSLSERLENLSDSSRRYERKRSYSVDGAISPSCSERDELLSESRVEAQSLIGALAQFAPDLRRAMQIPEHTHSQTDIDSLIKDETKTPLVVNRQLYRVHRQMRHSVLEASKRLEEEKLRRTHEELKNSQRVAGLVMRHGHGKETSSESAIKLMKQRDLDQQILVDSANKRGGRRRIKTMSDMSGMMLSSSRSPASPEPKHGGITTATISEEDIE